MESKMKWYLTSLVFLALSTPNAFAAILSYEDFSSDSSASSHGWTTFNNSLAGNSFGFQASSNAGGVPGEAGGVFSRNVIATKGYYADTVLDNLLTLDDHIYASGLLNISSTSNADASVLIGHFSTADFNGGNGNVIALDIAEAQTSTATSVRVNLRLSLSDGSSVTSDVGTSVAWANFASFDYDYDPTANLGLGRIVLNIRDSSSSILVTRVVDLNTTIRDTGATFNAFGISNYGMSENDTSQSLSFDVDNLTYTSGVVPEPSVVPHK